MLDIGHELQLGDAPDRAEIALGEAQERLSPTCARFLAVTVQGVEAQQSCQRERARQIACPVKRLTEQDFDRPARGR